MTAKLQQNSKALLLGNSRYLLLWLEISTYMKLPYTYKFTNCYIRIYGNSYKPLLYWFDSIYSFVFCVISCIRIHYELGQLTSFGLQEWYQIPGRVENFLFRHHGQTGFGCHLSFCLMCTSSVAWKWWLILGQGLEQTYMEVTRLILA